MNEAFIRQLYAAALDVAHTGMVIIDSDEKVILWNKWIATHSGIPHNHAEGKKLSEIFPDSKLSRIDFAIKNALKGMSSVISQSINPSPLPLFIDPRRKKEDKEILKQSIVTKSIKLGSSLKYVLIQIADVSAGARRESMLRMQGQELTKLAADFQKAREVAEVTLESITEAVLTTNDQEEINYINHAATTLLKTTEEALIGNVLSNVLPFTDVKHQQQSRKNIQSCLQKGYIGQLSDDASILIKGKTIDIDSKISPLRGKEEQIIGTVVVVEDVSHERNMREQLSFQASHDELTGLINRREFKYRLENAIHQCKTENKSSILLYLDLDQFKIVNDTCGHHAGDALLKQLSNLMQSKLRGTDTLARLGGDEFSILLPGCSEEIGLRIANTIREEVEEFRFRWEEQSFSVGTSIGLVEINNQSIDNDTVLNAADTACFLAKERGRNQVVCYEPDLDEVQQQQGEMLWAPRIQEALEFNQFELHCQPIMPTIWTPNAPIACEILVRMLDKDGNIIPPMAFIPAAERYNQMTKIDRWVVKAVIQSWQKDNRIFDNLEKLAINLSGQSFNDPDFLNFLIKTVEDAGCPWETLCFEITETAAVSNIQGAGDFMKTLKDKGAKFSLDDFGSGLSSFAYLKHLPVDYLKIDGIFVKDIVTDTMDDAMVKSINEIGHSLGLKTIAEYVEDDAIMERLREHKIDYAQGYGISKPFPFDQLTDFYNKLS